jgi:hypothetical protein
MMAKKENITKKVGRFAANELLGIDDMRRVVKYVRQGDFKKAAKSAGTAALELGTTVSGAGLAAKAGAKIGLTAGKAAARETSKKVGKEVLRSSNKAKGSGSMVYPKPAMGKKTATSPKRDVVVKTEDRTLAVKGRFINSKGEKSVKVNIKKPTVRVIEKEVTRNIANMRTAQSNRLRYGNVKADAARAREASVKASKKPAVGRAVGATAGAAAGAPARAAVTNSNKKKKNGK